ncbi:hypothetical protein Aph01nite_67000 [Acrocarpospora phusangensis]|uniref:Chaplin domain-containing protein n=1 Tax=Acrocarpospora phusangensis TaxID=1070424 RepID=A0A919QLB4_9ACTN|nr:hypothetical protein [Acrocarpospora phusangensis]GIH28390.1 hypothetical protein Aph01nite_67000 [Acrocarpospora phusangensis]
MMILYVAALAFASVAAPVAGDPTCCVVNHGHSHHMGNHRNSGNYHSDTNNINSGNYSNTDGSINSGNSSISSNNADGPQRIIITDRFVKRRCVLKRSC